MGAKRVRVIAGKQQPERGNASEKPESDGEAGRARQSE